MPFVLRYMRNVPRERPALICILGLPVRDKNGTTGGLVSPPFRLFNHLRKSESVRRDCEAFRRYFDRTDLLFIALDFQAILKSYP